MSVCVGGGVKARQNKMKIEQLSLKIKIMEIKPPERPKRCRAKWAVVNPDSIAVAHGPKHRTRTQEFKR